MKKEIADQWVDVLRSGKYEQGTYNLSAYNRYCCLGVLCEIAIKNGVDVVVTQINEVLHFSNEEHYLPEIVRKWAGMENGQGRFLNESLSKMNDQGETFEAIADTIEKNWEIL